MTLVDRCGVFSRRRRSELSKVVDELLYELAQRELDFGGDAA
ncbi:MAG TPA: hypothetical protein VK714_02865 [Myxococcota bacterium]|nr:hypothetical protein [Myxococcota bacterium]